MSFPALFLDFDGVLNSENWMRACEAAGRRWDCDRNMIDPAAVLRLSRIVDQTGARVVISSTWRLTRSLTRFRSLLGGFGFRGQIIAKTPQLFNQQRGVEIAHWLSRHPEVRTFAILDDSDDFDGVRDRLVRTEWPHGLLDHHVERVIAMLSEQKGVA